MVKARTAKSYAAFWPSLMTFAFLLSSSLAFAFLFTWPEQVRGLGILLVQGEIGQVVSPTAATVEKWLVEEGDPVVTGQSVLILRSYNEDATQIPVMAVASGFIAEIIAYPGTPVNVGESLALITAQGDNRKDLEIIGFVSSLLGKKLHAGMKANVWPTITDARRDGALMAVVKRVGKLPTSKAAVQSLVKIPELAKYMRNRIDGEPFLVVLSLVADEHHPTGYQWTGPGPGFALDYGVIANFAITYDQGNIISRLWPSLQHAFEGGR